MEVNIMSLCTIYKWSMPEQPMYLRDEVFSSTQFYQQHLPIIFIVMWTLLDITADIKVILLFLMGIDYV